jgi:hypothetical protein
MSGFASPEAQSQKAPVSLLYSLLYINYNHILLSRQLVLLPILIGITGEFSSRFLAVLLTLVCKYINTEED